MVAPLKGHYSPDFRGVKTRSVRSTRTADLPLCGRPGKAGYHGRGSRLRTGAERPALAWQAGLGARDSGLGARGDMMKNICWALIVLAAVAFAMGTWLAFTKGSFVLQPVGFWRGAVGFLAFAIALRVMDDRKS